MNIERFQVEVLKDIELSSSWPQMCNDPLVFLKEIARRLFVPIDTDKISENIIISPNIPSAENRSKLWVKTSWPYGVGFIANGEYQMDYGASGYPVGIPFLRQSISPKPAYVTELGDLKLKEFGMEDMQTKTTASKRMLWYIFEPPAIQV
jgi:hypothetical protein